MTKRQARFGLGIFTGYSGVNVTPTKRKVIVICEGSL